MTQTRFEQVTRQSLADRLPDCGTIVSEAREIARTIRIGRTAAFDRWGVESEAEFKQACIRDGVVSYHAHIGMGNWDLTERALANVFHEANLNNIEVHRAGLCLDRRMGLPEALRSKAAAETGPLLETPAHWGQIGQVTPIQPHMGDFMIGFPAATGNTVLALRAGVTTIGNLSQYFAHEAPGWHDHVATAVETTKSIAILGALRDRGVMLHSYLEDGFGALFLDCTSVAGWAYLEKYIVEDLLGAKLSHCIGGLTSDPVKRAGWVFALNEIHDRNCVGSMFYGDTISFSQSFDENRGLVAEYMLWDIMAQLECPTGHAVLPLPVTEAFRAPSWEEIVEAQILGHRVEATARRLHSRVDFSDSRTFSTQMQEHGKQVFRNALCGLEAAGVDIANPLQMLYTLKKLGPVLFEELFGAGQPDATELRGRKVIVPTDIFAQSLQCYKDNLPRFELPELADRIAGKRILLASTDVHEHAIMVLHWLLSNTGADVVYLGAEVDPAQVAEKAGEGALDAILISTHNGMALEYGNALVDALAEKQVRAPVLFGGVLNQKRGDLDLPVDVTAELAQIGIYTDSGLGNRLGTLLTLEKQTREENT
ncbi:cobalamin-dependent protein [Rhizobium sp. KVB221]|uniref:Cobalamin-dependent protein n=1 Tax=Rhizobium setariae TaxID=2801340 RepID=A0A936YPC8_9HYPH|nr:cobalamin-dependent protein [Rhizobium setariae]MBL0374218.1 cobalamin-dependent protein [Rhizobium setariae]